MPYVGNPLADAFSSREKQDLTGQSGTSFTLTHSVSHANDLSVYVNHVRQEPTTAYTVNGTTLTTTGSVAGTDDFYIIYDELALQSISHPTDQALTATSGTFTSGLVGTTATFSGALSATTGTFSGTVDIQGQELILDADNDTSITADTDDQIDFKTGGTDRMRLSSAGVLSIPADGSDLTGVTNAIHLGASADMKIFHNGGNNYILTDQASQSFTVLSDVVRFNTRDNGESLFGATKDAAFFAKYDNATKIATTANGIGVENGTTYAHDTNMKGVDIGDQAFYGEYDGGSGYLVKNRYYNGSNWVAKENGAGSAINLDTSGRTHIQHSANVNAGQNATFTSIVSIQEDYAIFKQTRNSVAQYFQNLHSSAPYGVYIEFPNVNVNNTDNYFLSCVSQGNGRMKIFSEGTLKNSTGTYTSFSDERLKSDIVDAKSQWEDIKALKFKNFIKFDNPDFKQLGLIAQDVEKVCPNLVFETPPEAQEIKHSSEFGTLNEDGEVKEVKSNVKNVKDSILYMKSVKALQEAMARIETLEAKVKALEEA